jgi:predicted ATPase
MQLNLRNIGPIYSINFNVNADLTFIYGKNNIGKSYAITILYLILKNYAFDVPYINQYTYRFFPRIRVDDNTVLKELKGRLENNSDNPDITDIVTGYFSNFMAAIFSARFENSLRNSFGDITNLNNKITNSHFEIELDFVEFKVYITEKNNKLITEFDNKGRKYICRKIQRHFHPRRENENIVLYYNNDTQFMEDIQDYINTLYKNSVIEIISKINNVYYLPASRSGLYRALTAFSQILVELAKKRSFLREKIILPSISEQDSDYFSKINEINIKRINQRYSSIAQDIEKRLLKGEVFFDQTTKQILFRPDNVDINLELLGTSSMIAEVSPIVIYLRYIIGSEEEIRRKKDGAGIPVIFIEEPEAHLHPEAQATLIECFVDLVKMGAKLVITSHSNYIFNKLNNLIAKKIINKDIINGILFFQTDKGSCSKTIPISNFGMEDDNFVNVAESLYNEKVSIIENMEIDSDNQA